MDLLDDAGQVESCFGLFGDSANLDKMGGWFVPNIPLERKSFWTYPM